MPSFVLRKHMCAHTHANICRVFLKNIKLLLLEPSPGREKADGADRDKQRKNSHKATNERRSLKRLQLPSPPA